jgi:single-strand DNA-binding protein
MSAPVTLKGRLTRDPEMRFTNGGKPWVTFTVVTSRKFKDDQGQWQEKDTSFWDAIAYDTLAENIAENFVKGSLVVVTGFMKQEKWQDKGGENKTSWKVVADDAGLSLKQKTDAQKNTAPPKTTFTEPPPF